MDHMFSFKVFRTLTPLAALLALTAIVVISPRLASAETEIPAALAQKLLAPTAAEGAFDTPFYDAKEEPQTLNGLVGARSRGVVLNFWATWCLPCVREMPALDALAAKLRDRGVDVIAVSEDRNARDKVPAFFKDKGIENLDLHFDRKGQLSRKLGIDGLPTTLLIDATGQEVGRVKGVLAWDADEIAHYLASRLSAQTAQ